jgi:hypothetical protein
MKFLRGDLQVNAVADMFEQSCQELEWGFALKGRSSWVAMGETHGKRKYKNTF